MVWSSISTLGPAVLPEIPWQEPLRSVIVIGCPAIGAEGENVGGSTKACASLSNAETISNPIATKTRLTNIGEYPQVGNSDARKRVRTRFDECRNTHCK
jgi:hypothetical protein